MFLLYVGFTQVAGVTGWSWNAAIDPGTAVWMSLVFLMVGPGAEFIFRGYVLRNLEAYGPTAGAIANSVLAFDTPLGWTKMAFKSVMVIGYLVMLWAINRISKETKHESGIGGRQVANAAR